MPLKLAVRTRGNDVICDARVDLIAVRLQALSRVGIHDFFNGLLLAAWRLAVPHVTPVSDVSLCIANSSLACEFSALLLLTLAAKLAIGARVACWFRLVQV